MRAGILRKRRTLSIMPTYQCNAECSNCGTFSNPRVKERLSLAQICEAIDEAAALNFVNVVFTGGEPTLAGVTLHRALAYARSRGLHTRIVTNGYWARSLPAARKKLGELIDYGLQEINYSSGDEHAKFVPTERVCHAILAAYQAGINFHVNIEGGAGTRINKHHFLNNVLLAGIDREYLNTRIEESPWMPLSPVEKGDYPPDWYTSKDNLQARSGCGSLLQTIVLQANGEVGACCGLGLKQIPELNVSKVSEANPVRLAIERSESDMLMLLIHYLGPERILAWAGQKDAGIAWENMYAHRCQACKRLYSDPAIAAVLEKHIDEHLGDLISSVAIDELAWPEYLKDAG